MNHGELYGVHLGGPPDRLVGALDSVFLCISVIMWMGAGGRMGRCGLPVVGG